MDDKQNILTVGWYRGEVDFGVRATIQSLSQEEMDEFRAMCMVAIGTAEDMWRKAQAVEQLATPNQDSTNKKGGE